MRFLLGLVLILALAAAGVFVYAGRLPGPSVEIAKPAKYVGQSTPLEVAVTAPEAKIDAISIVFEQNGKQTPLFTLAAPGDAQVKQESAERVRITRTIDRQSVPDLKTGPARILVTATRPVVRGIRKVQTTAVRDVQVRLEKPPSR
jgi:predicted secreted protein